MRRRTVKRAPRIALYYWPTIQGRGEFVRLLLEDAGARYVDVARRPGGMAAMMRFLAGRGRGALPFAPPFVKVGDAVVRRRRTSAFLWRAARLVPRDELPGPRRSRSRSPSPTWSPRRTTRTIRSPAASTTRTRRRRLARGRS
jgi:hypothetical protein